MNAADLARAYACSARLVSNDELLIVAYELRCKSGTVKVICLRMMPYGYRTLILGDVKDEYEPLCRALGVEPHAVGHGLPARINPLDFGPLGRVGFGMAGDPECPQAFAAPF